jgi:hypothetical protein
MSASNTETTKPQYAGKDNHGRPKADYLAKLAACTDEQLAKECDQYIWLSAYASNNPRSDYHWMCDACYDECKRRNKVGIYSESHKRQFD